MAVIATATNMVTGAIPVGDGPVAFGVFIQPAPRFAGTPRYSNCHGKSVSELARQYDGLNAAAAALGFSSVTALQNAILAFCEGYQIQVGIFHRAENGGGEVWSA